jgi:hypothetical protein
MGLTQKLTLNHRIPQLAAVLDLLKVEQLLVVADWRVEFPVAAVFHHNYYHTQED